ncbi:LolA family protein [Litchfieldella rifensis]|uniref:Outer membrane lipoprotein carrier protein LolA n=1 Tax=Litchfieldella rifensis TaxID=762643 RepID=A0ABV7LQW6_9GAMM
MPRFLIAMLLLTGVTPALAFDLEALRTRLAEPAAIQGHFEQRSWLADQQTRLYSEGRFLYQRDRRVIWQLLTPVKSTMAFYVDMVFPPTRDNEDESSEEANLMLLSDRFAFAQQLVDLMGGNWPALSHYYHIELEGEPKDWQVRLTPLAPPLETWLGTLTLEGKDRLEKITLAAANGDALIVQLEEQRPLVDVSLQTFLSEWFARSPEASTEDARDNEETLEDK